MFTGHPWTLIATSSVMTVTTSPAVLRVNGLDPSAPITLVAGSAAVLTLEGGTGHALDSIGLYRLGETDTLVDWRYFNGSGFPPGVSTATLNYTVPGTVGTYEFRFLAEGGGVLTTTTVEVVPSTATMTVNGIAPPTSLIVTPGAALTVDVAGGPGHAFDWIGVAVAGAPDTDYIDWQYLNGSGNPPGVASATRFFTAPSTPGIYELRLFADNGYDRLTTSGAVVVSTTGPPTVSVTLTSPFPGTTFNAPTSVTLSATAAITGATITRVDFFTGSTLIGSASAAPYEATWTSPSVGAHVLTAAVVDSMTGVTTSAPTAVTIAASGSGAGTLATPIASPEGGVFSEPPSVTLTGDPTADIRYTLDGSEPSVSSTLYTAAIAIPANGATLKARAFKTGWTASVTLTAMYQPDTTPPYLSVTSPGPRVLVPPGTLTIRGTVIEVFSTATVTCEGTVAEVAGTEFTCDVSVPSGTSTVDIVATDADSNARTVLLEVTTSDQIGPEPTALRVTPQNVTLGVGEKRRFRATDDRGRVPADAEWTVDNGALATLATTSGVAGIELTAVAPGDVTITAAWHGQVATTVVSIVTTVVAGTTLWSNPPLLGGGAVEDVVRGATAPDGTRLLYAVERQDNAGVLRAFAPDGQEIWTQDLAGRIDQVSGDQLGGAVVLLRTNWPDNPPVRELRTFTPDGRGAVVTTADSPGFAIHPDGPLYVVVGQQLKGIDIGLGAGQTVVLPPSTVGDTIAGTPTVLADGSVTVPMRVTGGANSPGESLDLLWLRSNGTVDVYPVDRDPTQFFESFWVMPHKAIPNGLGGVAVAYDVHFYFAFPNDQARVQVVNADGSLGGGVAWGGGLGTWLPDGDLKAGDLVLAEDRIRATSYRFGSQGSHVRVSDISLDGYTMGDFFVPGDDLPRFTALDDGQFFESYADGSTWGPDPDHEAVQLAHAVYDGDLTFFGSADGAIALKTGGAVNAANSVWSDPQGGRQSANAPPFGRKFTSVDAAATEALLTFLRPSVISRREWGGRVCTTGPNQFFYTEPNRTGGSCSEVAPPACWAGTERAARYHTHPCDDPQDGPSSEDINNVRMEGTPGYVGVAGDTNDPDHAPPHIQLANCSPRGEGNLFKYVAEPDLVNNQLVLKSLQIIACIPFQ